MNFSDPLDLSQFRIILPATRAVSLSELRISTNRFVFTRVAAAELVYPDYVCLLFSEAEQQLAIVPCEANEYAMPFFSEEHEHTKKLVAITHTTLVSAIRQRMGWQGSQTYRIPGFKVCAQDGTTCLVFDLRLARSGKRLKKTTDPLQFLDSCPTMEDIRDKSRYKQIALLPRQAPIIDVDASLV